MKTFPSLLNQSGCPIPGKRWAMRDVGDTHNDMVTVCILPLAYFVLFALSYLLYVVRPCVCVVIT